MQHIAVIDLGSNAARIVVLSAVPGHAYRLEDEIREVVRLRQGMTAGKLTEESMARALVTLRLFTCEIGLRTACSLGKHGRARYGLGRRTRLRRRPSTNSAPRSARLPKSTPSPSMSDLSSIVQPGPRYGPSIHYCAASVGHCVICNEFDFGCDSCVYFVWARKSLRHDSR